MDEIALDALVLLAIALRPRDLAKVRDERWYRIPLSRAPRALAAEWLAFYQPAAFGAERWSVRSMAEVLSVGVVARAALLPDEPAHPRATERYYRFDLGPLLALPTPLLSRRLRRISFIPTTYGQLLRARDVAELWRAPEDAEGGWDVVWGAGVNRR